MGKGKIAWVVLVVHDPLPHEASRNGSGPFYAPGSRWYSPPEHRAHVELQAAGLRERGLRCDVVTEVR